jgi:hypothetical protein
MRPHEKLIALGVTWLNAVHTAELVATEARDLYDTCVIHGEEAEHPETAKVFFRVLVSMRALQSKMNQRFEEFGKEVIQYYRAYLIALDEAFQGSVYEDALYILLKWQGVLDSQVSKHPTTVRGLVHVLKTWKLSATNEIEILGEIHRVLHDAITEAKKNAASLKAHHEDVSR